VRVLEMSKMPARTYFHIDTGTQFAVAAPQHRLYFVPELQGHGLFARHWKRATDSRCLTIQPFLKTARTPILQCLQ
jgi:hypothetical protein